MKIKFRISSIMIIILLSVASHQKAEADNVKFSLAPSIQPIKYKLELLIDVQHEWPHYEERVTITVKCEKQQTDAILINVKRNDITINEGNVRVTLFKSNPEKIIGVKDHVFEADKDIHIIQLSEFLEVNKIYEVFIPFEKAEGSPKTKGYYFDEHEDALKNGKEYIVTQLGPGDARGIFPCLDQIHLKAKFKVFLKHSENFWAFSNTKKLDTKTVSDITNFVEDEFDESPAMSTNNIAFALINSKKFERLEVPEGGTLQLFAVQTVISNMYYAHEVSLRIMNFYSDFFQCKYIIPQLNIIALPNFQDKDKEKYGILTLQDSSILSNDEYGQGSKADTVLYICHSISHQWLGSRVTVSSWSIYWLHEAFAYLLEKPCLEYIFSEQKFSVFDSQIAKTVTLLLQYDVVATPYRMLDFDYFDKIDTYRLEDPIFSKAFCMVRMLNFAFGEKLLQECLASYMKTLISTSTSLKDVGDLFTKVVNESDTFSDQIDVYNMMNSWASKNGFPLLNVTRANKGEAVKIVQKNFRLYYDQSEALIGDTSCWPMPLRITTNKDETPDNNNKVYHWINCAKPFFIDMKVNENDWMILDLRLNVLCRINYEKENWNSIQKLLMNPDEYFKINTLSRVQLISDMFAFAENEILSYDMVLETMKYLVHENSSLPMTTAVNELLKIRYRLFGSEIFNSFQIYVRNIMKVIFDKEAVPKDIDDPSNSTREKFQFQRLIIKTSCIFGVEKCQNLGKEVFKEWRAGAEEDEDVEDDREALYCQAMKTASMGDWKFLWRKYNVEQLGSKFNDDILSALGCTSNPKLLNYYVHWIIKKMDHQISPEDGPKVFESISMNERGYPLMKTFILDHFEDIKDFVKGSSVSVDFYLEKLLDVTTKKADLDDLKAIIEKKNKNLDGFAMNVRNAERNIWWLETYTEKLSLIFKTETLPSEFDQITL